MKIAKQTQKNMTPGTTGTSQNNCHSFQNLATKNRRFVSPMEKLSTKSHQVSTNYPQKYPQNYPQMDEEKGCIRPEEGDILLV